MALNFSTISSSSLLLLQSKPPLNSKLHKNILFKRYYFYYYNNESLLTSFSSFTTPAALSEGGFTDENPPSYSGSSSSAQTQLDLLEQLTSGTTSVDGYESDGSSGRLTIRDQLAQLVGDRDDDFTIPLGKNLKKFTPKVLTISQKRNIKRQDYLNEVSKRNDSVFFATIGAFVIFPPLIILGIAIATGYVQLLP